MLFSPLDSSEDFMGRRGLRFSLSVIVSELWRHQWRHNELCGLHPGREPRSIAASFISVTFRAAQSLTAAVYCLCKHFVFCDSSCGSSVATMHEPGSMYYIASFYVRQEVSYSCTPRTRSWRSQWNREKYVSLLILGDEIRNSCYPFFLAFLLDEHQYGRQR